MTRALLVVDVQNWGFAGDWPVPDSAALLQRIDAEIQRSRAAGDLVAWVQNDGGADEMDAPGEFFWELTLTPAEGETVWRKTTQDVFESQPALADFFREHDITEIDLIGLQSEMCVRSSTLGARAAGFTASPMPGLHGTYPEGFFEPDGPKGMSASRISAGVDDELSE
jgi:nicotinamidase-related amidase